MNNKIKQRIEYIQCPICHQQAQILCFEVDFRDEIVKIRNCKNCEKIKQQELYRYNRHKIKYEINSILKNAMLPAKYMDDNISFETFPKNDIKSVGITNKIKEYMRNPGGRFLTLYGAMGAGKTAFSVLVAKYITGTYVEARIKQSKSIPDKYVRFTTTQQLVSDMSNGIYELKIEKKLVKDLYSNIPLLIIDDFGTELSMFALSKIYDIIDYRYSNNKMTIVTTNLRLDMIEKNRSSLLVAIKSGNNKDWTEQTLAIINRVWDRLKGNNNIVCLLDWESLR